MAALNRQDLTRKIQSLTDLSPDEKSTLLELLNTRKKYGLVWEDKPEKVEDDLRTQFPVLTEVADRRIVGPEGSPNHVLIEGDNLHALTALQYTHEGCVDVIYIDPPYNTGNKDFVYNDHFVDKEDQWRHSKWLSFMEKRLKLAKALLKQTGVIFISIDDNEQAPLRMLCDEIFGAENFIATVIWQKVFSPKNSAQHFSTDHEYIAVIAKKAEVWRPALLARTEEMEARYSNPDEDPRGPWTSGDLSARNYYGEGTYAITTPSGRIIEGPPPGTYWRVSSENFQRLDSEGRIWWGPNGSNQPRLKRFLSEVKAGRVPQTLWKYDEVGHTQEAKKELLDLVTFASSDDTFDTPKPTRLLKQILSIAAKDRAAIVLDFFAGSGTFLQSTMSINAEDGGHRQCILVTNNENSICEQVTYERNRRVIQGYTNAKGVVVAGLTANSLRYYKTSFVGRERSQKNRRDLTRASVDLLCLRENSYTERPDLTSADRRAFEGPTHLLFVLFDPEVIPETVGLIAAAPKHCKVYVFSPGAYAWDDEFEDVKHKITLCALPEALIQAFQKVMPAEGQPAQYDGAADGASEVGE